MRCSSSPILLLVALFFLGTVSCACAQSQVEMTAQSWAEFDKADKELNAVYQKLLKSLEDDIARKKLIAAQKAWVAFRDAQAELDADAERGGSLENQERAISETETTKARIEELKGRLDSHSAKDY